MEELEEENITLVVSLEGAQKDKEAIQL